MKASRRLLAMVLAVTMVFSMGLTGAFATGAAQDSGTVTVTATAGSSEITVKGATTKITPVVKYKDSGDSGDEQDVTNNATITYSSSDEETATVDTSSGVVTAVAAGTVTITVKAVYQGITATATVDITVKAAAAKTLSSIAVTTQPTKTTYTVGESFDKNGMVVTATYSDVSTAAVANYAFTPAGALAKTDTKVIVSYTEGNVTKTADVTITVKEAVTPPTVNAAKPAITKNLVDTTYALNAKAPALSITATVSDNGTLTYQWYSNSKQETNGATKIANATSASYMPSTTTLGTTYYYCVVTNTNSAVNGSKTAAADSNIVKVVVNPASVPGGSADYAKLEEAMKAADLAKKDVKISVDGKDVATTSKWTTQASYDALINALKAADVVYKDNNATQAEVDKQVTLLKAATETFTKALKNGTNKPTPPTPEKPDAGNVTEADKNITAGGDKAKDEIKNAVADVANDANATPAQKDAAKAVTDAVTKPNAPIAEVAKTVTENFEKLPEAVQTAVKESVLAQVNETVDKIADATNADKEAMDTKAIADLENLLKAVGVPAAKVTGDIQPDMSGATLSTDENGAQVTVEVTAPEDKAEDLIPNLPENTTNTKVIELNLTVGGELANVKAPITFTFKCSDLGLSPNAKNIKVYHITSDGKTVELSATSVSGGKVTFTVGSFSSIVFAEVSTGSTGNTTGSSGGGSKSSLTFGGAFDTKTETTSANVGANGAVNATAAANDATKAVKDALAKKTTASITVTNALTITPDALKAIADAAKKAGGTVIVNADTTYAGKTIARISIDPAKAAALGKEIKLSVATDAASVAATKTRFDKYFTNKMAVASFAQQGSFGMTVNAAVRVDLTGLNAKTLRLYSFDKATNKYVAISTQGMFVDANGFLHFNTSLGGDILITDAPLTAKK